MKKIISSLLISLSIASCAYTPNVTSTLDNVKKDTYVFNVGKNNIGATISANINLNLPSKFKTKAAGPLNIDGTPAKTALDVLTVQVYLLALPTAYAGTDPLTDTSLITNVTNPISFTFVPTNPAFGVKFTNVGTSPLGTNYYVGVIAKDNGGNVVSKNISGVADIVWTGASTGTGLCLSSTTVTVDNSLAVSTTNPIDVNLKLKDATGATVSSNITINNGSTYSYASDMLGLNYITGGGTMTPVLSNGLVSSNVLLQGSSDLTVDNLGNVYVLDITNNTVFYVNKSGFVTVVASGLVSPIALSVNSLGDVFVLSSGMVSKFTKQGLGVYSRKDFTDPSFTNVQDLSLSSTNSNIVYVANANGASSSVLKLDTSTPTGTVSTYFANLAADPYSMSIDSNDNLYFVYQTPANNKQVDTLKNGVLSTLYTSVDPMAVFTDVNVDHTGNVYVANNSTLAGKGSILKLSSSGSLLTTLAGGGSATINMNGLPGTYASLNPTFISIEPGKDLSGDPAIYFVDDTSNAHTNLIVRKLVP